MIILVQPMYSRQELNGDSNYVMYSAFIRAMQTVRPSWHFIVIWPDDKSGFKYDDDGFFQLPNVSRVPQRTSTRKMANAITYDAGWYDALLRQYGIDLVWCHLVEIAGNIKHAGDNPYAAAAMPVVVAAHHYMIHSSLPYPFESQEHVAWAQIGGATQADYNVFNTQHTHRMFVDTAQRWLTDAAIERVLSRSTVIGEGVLETSARPKPHANDEPIIIYNHRLQGYKNYKETFAVLDELYKEGLRFKVRFTNATRENTAAVLGYPFVELKLCATRREYLAAIADGDLNVTNSQHETFCLSAIESMAFGQCLVAPNGVTFPEITGKLAGATEYPYLFNSRDEQKAMLRKLLSDAGERARWGRILSDYVRREYAQPLWAERNAQLFERLQPAIPKAADDAHAMLVEQLRKHSGATLRDIHSKITQTAVNGRNPYARQSLPLCKLLRIARHEGARITMQKGEQRVYM